jgi:hypothetical protein
MYCTVSAKPPAREAWHLASTSIIRRRPPRRPAPLLRESRRTTKVLRVLQGRARCPAPASVRVRSSRLRKIAHARNAGNRASRRKHRPRLTDRCRGSERRTSCRASSRFRDPWRRPVRPRRCRREGSTSRSGPNTFAAAGALRRPSTRLAGCRSRLGSTDLPDELRMKNPCIGLRIILHALAIVPRLSVIAQSEIDQPLLDKSQ